MQTGGSTAQELVGSVQKRLEGQLPTSGVYNAERLAAQDAATSGTDLQAPNLGTIAGVTPTIVSAPQEVVETARPDTGTYDIQPATTTPQVQQISAQAAQLQRADVAPEVKIDAPQGTLSPEAVATAAQTEVQQEQLVGFQLGELYKSIEEGQPLPAWATGPVRAATSIMQQRGLGASSMAAAAVSQAVLESGLPIAAQQAAEYSKINTLNLNNRQQAVLQNASTMAQMDITNLDARMKSAVANAQNFLSIDVANLSNEQATETLNYQGLLQSVFTDAAGQNAAAQFNAKSQQQVDEFFAELGVQVDNANINRASAISQFNVDQVNSVAQFNTSLDDARNRFDASMRVQIDQSNAAWRRQIATADTAAVNEQNRLNALNTLQISQSALSALWQRYRDESAWLMQSTENAASRAHQLAMLEFEKEANVDMFGLESEYETYASVGSASLALLLGFATEGN
ncbi:MAG TPA: hypothetical protein DEG69_18875 [Flavobacteriaceae bacterium]|nr:hypothetical protein [Flavobacteriaceae bacterium]